MWSYQHPGFIVHQLAALRDNYIYLIESDLKNTLIAVDPAEAASVRKACKTLAKPLTHIFNTHHHWDHTDGNLSLKKDFDCLIVGAANDAARIPGIDITVSEASPPVIPGLDVLALDVPGHTCGHIAYCIHDALFCGDTLFGAGCGRLFEGTASQMWHSLNKLAKLDGKTKVYCAHEYTLANLAYADAIDTNNPALIARITADRKRRNQNHPTIPSSIEIERATNPFLRPIEPDFCRKYAMKHNISSEPLDVFTDIRNRKDRWQ
ncbi:MAG: hydroxyacylglutathione hydrolase [Mariprofundus sp.]